MRRKAASLLLVAMMMSVAVPVHASEQATVTIQESQGENREVDQVQSLSLIHISEPTRH